MRAFRWSAIPWMILLLFGSLAVWAEESVERTVAVSPDVRVEVENLSGSVWIEGSASGEVRIEARLGDDTEGLEVRGGASEVRIEVKIPEGTRSHRRWDLESHLRIWVPSGASIEVETVSASVEVRSVMGELDVETVSGSITAESGSSRVELSTVSGNVDFTGAGAPVDVESVSGRIRLRGVGGQIEASTVSGGIDVEGEGISRADFESVSGSIELTGSLASGARLDASSHSGNVELTLPADTRASFEIETFAGDIHSDFGGEARRTSRYAPGRELYHSTGDDAEISVETFSGNVYLGKRR